MKLAALIRMHDGDNTKWKEKNPIARYVSDEYNDNMALTYAIYYHIDCVWCRV